MCIQGSFGCVYRALLGVCIGLFWGCVHGSFRCVHTAILSGDTGLFWVYRGLF